mgnify:FL=1
MSKKNPEYDFEWCPGCGDFGVRRALESAIQKYTIELEKPIHNTVVVAGIGCSGNMVHVLEGEQPYGIHGIHGRTLPIAMGVKMANQDLNVIVVAGDGDFLSIGMEHIFPQASRNLNISVIVMDNAVYGLTKGQGSPTSQIGHVTSSTPFGNTVDGLNPLKLYLTLGVSYIASGISSKVKDLSELMYSGMLHPGFSIVHVQSPCTTYHNTYEQLKGNVKKGIAPLAWQVEEDHNPGDIKSAQAAIEKGGIPLGTLYQDSNRPTFGKRIQSIGDKSKPKSTKDLLDSHSIVL